jgi:hypothetical protein
VVVSAVRHESSYIEGIIFCGIANSLSNNFLRIAAGIALYLLTSISCAHAARIALEVYTTTGHTSVSIVRSDISSLAVMYVTLGS